MGAQVGGKKCGTMSVTPGRPSPVYVAPLNTDKHSKGATLGQYLSGTATFAKEDAGKKVDVYNFKYILQEGSKKREKEKDKGKKKAEELYSELLKNGGENSVITSIHAAKLAN